MIFTNAKYIKYEGDSNNSGIRVTIDGVGSSVPIDPSNIHYAEIMKQVDAGTLTIQAAD